MASFAKAQGVFNRNPNQRNEIEDAEDYDPLAPQFYADRKPNPSGDGGGGILDQEEAKEVVLVGGQESTEYYEGNPFED